MQIWEAALLGLVQGLTEFLPVSSSAHLRILGQVLPSGSDPGAAFTAIVQIGTELAVLVHFRRNLIAMLRAVLAQLLRRPGYDAASARLGWIVAIGSLPIVALGLALQGAIETVLRDLYLTAAMLIGFGLVLALADRIGSKTLTLDRLGWRSGIALGFAQALALIPGVSRSGATITGALLLGFSRPAAARFSFLLAVPAVFGSGLYQLAKSWGDPQRAALAPTVVATLTAFLTGYFVIVGFMRLISRISFRPFVCYRVALGLLLLALLWAGVLSPG